jgi:hypothetical protein
MSLDSRLEDKKILSRMVATVPQIYNMFLISLLMVFHLLVQFTDIKS